MAKDIIDEIPEIWGKQYKWIESRQSRPKV